MLEIENTTKSHSNLCNNSLVALLNHPLAHFNIFHIRSICLMATIPSPQLMRHCHLSFNAFRIRNTCPNAPLHYCFVSTSSSHTTLFYPNCSQIFARKNGMTKQSMLYTTNFSKTFYNNSSLQNVSLGSPLLSGLIKSSMICHCYVCISCIAYFTTWHKLNSRWHQGKKSLLSYPRSLHGRLATNLKNAQDIGIQY